MKILVLCLLLCLCLDSAWSRRRTAKYIRAIAQYRIPGSYIVVMKSDSDVDDILSRIRRDFDEYAVVKSSFNGRMKGFVIDLPEYDKHDLDNLLNDPKVDYVEEDALVSVAAVESWGLDRIDQADLPLDGMYNAPGDGDGFNVYVIDTGIQRNQQDFPNRPNNFADFTGKRRHKDCNGHGTHVAGTIGSTTYGVAKNVQLHSVRVFGCSGTAPWSTIIAGINEVAERGTAPAVVNLSLSGNFNQATNDAIENLKAAGFLPIVAAGNNADDACDYTPASSPGSFTVGGTDMDDSLFVASNFGPCTHLYAPAVGITSLKNKRRGTAVKTGTSMAAPHVSGIAAIIWGANTTLTADEVREQVLQIAVPGKVTGSGVCPDDLLAQVY
ncbi:extracellular serine proteinase-like [Ptychodera flava]|uniref:extracellular serine proteinase-like n=1 Tax=Ptychodera flava TaxID=63121 RepID=UPI00396A0687